MKDKEDVRAKVREEVHMCMMDVYDVREEPGLTDTPTSTNLVIILNARGSNHDF